MFLISNGNNLFSEEKFLLDLKGSTVVFRKRKEVVIVIMKHMC